MPGAGRPDSDPPESEARRSRRRTLPGVAGHGRRARPLPPKQRRAARVARVAGRWQGVGAVRRAGGGEPRADVAADERRGPGGARGAGGAARTGPGPARLRPGGHPHLLRAALPARAALPPAAGRVAVRVGLRLGRGRSRGLPAAAAAPPGARRREPGVRPARPSAPAAVRAPAHGLLPVPDLARLPAARARDRPLRPPVPVGAHRAGARWVGGVRAGVRGLALAHRAAVGAAPAGPGRGTVRRRVDGRRVRQRHLGRHARHHPGGRLVGLAARGGAAQWDSVRPRRDWGQRRARDRAVPRARLRTATGAAPGSGHRLRCRDDDAEPLQPARGHAHRVGLAP